MAGVPGPGEALPRRGRDRAAAAGMPGIAVKGPENVT